MVWNRRNSREKMAGVRVKSFFLCLTFEPLIEAVE